MKTQQINLQFLTITDTDRLVELLIDTPDEAFELTNGPEGSCVSWEIETDFCKHFHLTWQGKEMNVWISRKSMFGSPMLLLYCAEYRSKEWWESFPEGTLPNDGGRSYRIQEGRSDTIARWESQVLQLTGSEKHIRLVELTINQ